MMAQRTPVYLYTRYERFWHWFQAATIIGLLVTGFEVHGSWTLLGFDTAVTVHNALGLTWLVAFAFFIFWIATTGEWKQYVPTTKKMIEVVHYYAIGIFRGEPHPVPKRKQAKHNPLQRLTYLFLAAALLPVQMVSGMAYWGYNQWPALKLDWLSLEMVALVHVAGGFAILGFLIVHVYMTTTGHSVTAHTKAMITGWEDVDTGVALQPWEQRPDHPQAH